MLQSYEAFFFRNEGYYNYSIRCTYLSEQMRSWGTTGHRCPLSVGVSLGAPEAGVRPEITLQLTSAALSWNLRVKKKEVKCLGFLFSGPGLCCQGVVGSEAGKTPSPQLLLSYC